MRQVDEKGVGCFNVAHVVSFGKQLVDLTTAGDPAIDLREDFFTRDPDSLNLYEKSHENGREKVMKRVFHEERKESQRKKVSKKQYQGGTSNAKEKARETILQGSNSEKNTRRELFSESSPDLFPNVFNPPLPLPCEYSPISLSRIRNFLQS